jgi:Na+(H+)/acetate symporter ActP
MFNGLLKIPMQFIILFIGAMVFVFFQFNQPPVFFNDAAVQEVKSNPANKQLYEETELAYQQIFEQKRDKVEALALSNSDTEVEALQADIKKLENESDLLRDKAKSIIKSTDEDLETNDTDYVFISFVMKYLPSGVIGLLLAVIFSAAMSSTASELNALASTTIVDVYKRNLNTKGSEKHYLIASKMATLLWGAIAVGFALFAGLLDNLIQAVNILGSIFYGTILGIFLVGFFIKQVKGQAVFIAAVIAQLIVLYFYFFTEVAYLWFNVIGCFAVIIISFAIQQLKK